MYICNQRIHSQLEDVAYSICLTLEMLTRRNLYYNIYLPAFSAFLMLREKAQC